MHASLFLSSHYVEKDKAGASKGTRGGGVVAPNSEKLGKEPNGVKLEFEVLV